ncbi:MAG: MFS transporter [Chloroflexi bacterium]|nr:MFS transporter [Chloroflexota bacterium]
MQRLARRDAIILLAVLGTGVFLAGLELMITAVALPAIVTDLATWARLREASWIINGYLLVYVVTMPLAGRLADLWGNRRVFLGALGLFTIGSALAGAAPTLELLIVARLVQAAGGGALVPVATSAASHLFPGSGRSRALGVIGALTFLGMAAGPFLGAAILDVIHPEVALARLGVAPGSALADALAPAWRWVFYVNVPVGVGALALAWAASSGWETPRRSGRVDVVGALLFSAFLVGALGALTLLGSRAEGGEASGLGSGLDPATIGLVLAGIAAVAGPVSIIRGLRVQDPFLDPRLFRHAGFASAALVSVLTGYGLATAIVGAAVFVDRVLYGGPAEQQVALGALAAATAVAALLSGFAVRVFSLRLVTVAGLSASIVGLVLMAGWTPETSVQSAAAALALFGAGFGLTVTPRSTAAVEAVAVEQYGIASSTVTVARMIGMAVGLAILTAYGSTTIDRLYDQVYASSDAYLQYVPEALQGRQLKDPLVVEALEAWAAGEAARIMVGIFLVAAVVTAAAVPPALLLDRRRRRLAPREPVPAPATAPGADGAVGRAEPGRHNPDPAAGPPAAGPPAAGPGGTA